MDLQRRWRRHCIESVNLCSGGSRSLTVPNKHLHPSSCLHVVDMSEAGADVCDESKDDAGRWPSPSEVALAMPKFLVWEGSHTGSQHRQPQATCHNSIHDGPLHPKMASVAEKIFTLTAQRSPKPINIASSTVTRVFYSAYNHTYHPRVVRRLAAFDASKLHMLVLVKQSKHATALIRRHAARRFRAQLSQALRERGYNWDGTLRKGVARVDSTQPAHLSGAYLFQLINLPAALNEKASEIRRQCAEAVQQMETNMQVWSKSSKGGVT